MSFIERNKAWILPLLGIAATGVVYLNVKMMGRQAPPSPGPGSLPAVQALPPPVVPVSPPPHPGDLWADLRALEGPWSHLNHTQELLKAAEHPVASLEAPRMPVEGDWSRLTDPRVVLPQGGGATLAPGGPAPEVAFIADTPKGRQAWMEGRPWVEGQVLPGGYRVKRILGDRVVLEGPSATVECFTHGLRPSDRLSVPARLEAP